MIFGKGSKASFLNKYCGNNWIYMTCTLHYIKKLNQAGSWTHKASRSKCKHKMISLQHWIEIS